jgi:hypothetical protein
MKKIAFIFCSFFIMQFASSQKLIVEEGLDLKRGIYLTYDEFRYNSPSLPLEFEIIKIDTGIIYHLKTDKERIAPIGVIWGFCDGKNIYINRDFNMSNKRVFRPDSQFNKIIYIGRYCYFLTAPSNPGLMFPQYLPFAIDFNSGEELCLNCELNFWFIKQSQFKKIISRDPELWADYKKDKSREDKFLKYIKLYSERYKDEIFN